jgi:hypothetical protein
MPSRPLTVSCRPLSPVTLVDAAGGPCPADALVPVAFNQLQAGHHASLGKGVQGAAFGAIQVDASRRRSEQYGDHAVLASRPPHGTVITIHDHVGFLPLMISSPRTVDRCTDKLGEPDCPAPLRSHVSA